MKQPRMFFKYLAAASSVLVALFLSEKIHIVTSDSVDPRVYWKSSESVIKGDYIIFSLKDDVISPHPVAMTKKVVCTSGQSLSYKNRSIYCDGRYLGSAHETSHDGTPLNLFYSPGLIPEGKLILFGDHPDSYDSRYWGFFDISNSHTVIKPIF